jgi:hypothetical protein
MVFRTRSRKKLYLAAIPFDILVTRHAVVLNPAASARELPVIEGNTGNHDRTGGVLIVH